MAFLIPFVLTDLVSINRDVYYGVFIVSVFAFVGLWLRFATEFPRAVLTRNWRRGAVLGVLFIGAMIGIVLRESGTSHPHHARRLADRHGWTIAPAGQYFRRVVPSPEPREIVELSSIKRLVAAGTVVVCAGGGGVPVIAAERRLRGVEAVIDKDLTAALPAEQLHADRLLMLTDVPFVQRDWGSPAARPIENATANQLRGLRFAAGSMGPKVEAACRFVERTGREAAIGALADLDAVARGEAGTRITTGRADSSAPTRHKPVSATSLAETLHA